MVSTIVSHRFHTFNTRKVLGVHRHACGLTGNSKLVLHVESSLPVLAVID